MLGVHLFFFTLPDAKQPVEIPADLASPLDIGRDPLRRVVSVFLGMPSRLLGIIVGSDDPPRQFVLRLPAQHINTPGLSIRPRWRAGGGFEDRFDRVLGDFPWQESTHRPARANRGFDWISGAIVHC